MKIPSVVLVTHSFTTGQPDMLIEFLKERVSQLVVIRHPFFYARDTASQTEFYRNGVKVKVDRFHPLRIGEAFLYSKDLMLTIFTALKFRRKSKVYIGVDCLNAFAGILLRKVGGVEKVVMYTIDLPVKRFDNPILNLLYHKLDVYCAKHCDGIWNLSPRMEKVRLMFGWRPKKKVTTLVVPAAFKRTVKCASSPINSHRLVFVGHLKESQGLQLVVEAFPEILKKVPDAKLVVIGTGPYEEKLREMAHKLGLRDAIKFFGHINDHQDVERILLGEGIGLAPYEPDLTGITTYADPMKLKVYMACGLPIVVTRVPWISKCIEQKGAGVVIEYSKDELINAVLKLMSDNDFYLTCRRRTLELATEYDPVTIFSMAMKNTVL
jgi:glycosyltransferase involved in cell wall biosynthesis